VLDDRRVVRVRFDEAPEFAPDWSDGGVLSFAGTSGDAAAPFHVSDLVVRDATGYLCP
jgi:hypothetical protein